MTSGMLGIILAGGQSQRFGGADALPKPLVEVSGAPMVVQAAAKLVNEGAERICVLTGRNHEALMSGLEMHDTSSQLTTGSGRTVPFELRFSGIDRGTGGRLLALDRSEIGDAALLAYTDVFTDAPIDDLVTLLQRREAVLSMLTISPRQPWGVVHSEDEVVTGFHEKPVDHGLHVNGGFFAVNGAVLDHVESDSEMLEAQPMQRMIAANKVMSLFHDGRWACVDSPKDLPDIERSSSAFFDPAAPPTLLHQR